MRAFLDANVLFSGALGGAAFDVLWALAASKKIELLTSAYCYLEARTNLDRKAPGALPGLDERMLLVCVVKNDADHMPWALSLLPEKDAPVLAAARAAAADVLLTGDLRHFAHLMRRADLPVSVMTVRTLLLEHDVAGPAARASREPDTRGARPSRQRR